MADWMQLDQTYIMSTVQRYPITISKAEGNYISDTNGKRYLDLFTGLGVNVLGHSHPQLMKALDQQGHSFLHISNLFLNPPAIRLAERLVHYTFGSGKVYFSNSGAEATEAAIKLIHMWSEPHRKRGIVVLKNSFHGRTLGALRLTRQLDVYQDFPKLDLPVFEVEPNRIEILQQVCEQNNPAAILVEPILGAGGVVTLNKSYLQSIGEICTRHDILFCVDEIQTGIGRTGTLFAYQSFQIKPDLILFAKGIGGGLPLGGVIANKKLSQVFQPGDHGTTFAPSPLSAALGNAVLDVLLQDGMLDFGRQAADQLWTALHSLQKRYPQLICHLDGRGMMIGIYMKCPPEVVKAIQLKLLKNGILVNVTARSIIRLLPPLTLTMDEIVEFITVFEQILKKLISREERL